MAPVILGEARYEMFRLCIDMDRSQEIYPIIKAPQFQSACSLSGCRSMLELSWFFRCTSGCF